MKILAISLGTRDSGIAIISYGQLVHWKMHTFHERWSNEKLTYILGRYDRYITQHRIQHVVIKIPPATHHSKALLSLLKKLSELLQSRGCITACQTKADIKEIVPEVTNTKTLMEYVVRQYPILLPEQTQELLSRQPYHIKMFEAVLAAHVYKQGVNWERFTGI
jgi:RNase H-fold protein (predicted Holliday junction resolvase)